MKEIKIPYETWMERMNSKDLEDSFEKVGEKWKDKFNTQDIKSIIQNLFFGEENNRSLTDDGMAKVMDGTFTNYYYWKGYVKDLKRYIKNLDRDPFEIGEDLRNLIIYGEKTFGREYMDGVLKNYKKDRKLE